MSYKLHTSQPSPAKEVGEGKCQDTALVGTEGGPCSARLAAR